MNLLILFYRVGSMPARPEFNNRDASPENVRVGSGASHRFHKRNSRRMSYNVSTASAGSYGEEGKSQVSSLEIKRYLHCVLDV